MAFKVKQIKSKLQEFGVPSENLEAAAEYICSAHKTDLDAIIEERDEAREQAKAVPTLQAEVEKLKNSNAEAIQAKLDQVQTEFDQFKADVAAEKTLDAKTAAFRSILGGLGIPEKRIETILKVSKDAINAVEIGADGKATNKDKITADMRTEWAEFIPTFQDKGANPANPPASTPQGLTKEDIYKTDDKGRFVMDAAQRQAALVELHKNQ